MNSFRISFFARKLKIHARKPETTVNPTHQRGSIHQPGDSFGVKFVMIFTNTRQGRAISNDSGESNEKADSGRTFLLIM